jgi:hypothetical protein
MHKIPLNRLYKAPKVPLEVLEFYVRELEVVQNIARIAQDQLVRL